MKRLALACALAAAAPASAQVCYNYLNRQTYQAGFQAGDFSSTAQTQLTNGDLQLNTALSPINTENIKLPFDQDVTVKYVYESAGGSHSFGWFYYDQIAPFLDVNGNLKDADADGVPDFFQTKAGVRPNNGLFIDSNLNGTPDLLDGNLNYSDGGAYPHIPNLLETYMNNGGGLVYGLCDDDGDLATGGAPPQLPPVADSSASYDGIPDYDVNGNGVVGDVGDRTVDLGVIQGNREIVFFYIMYYDQAVRGKAVGQPTNNIYGTKIMPFFSKSMLNPDRGSVAANTTLKTIDIGCGYPNVCNGVSGWLDQATLDRLNTPAYLNLVLPHQVKSIVSGAQAYPPHLFLGAPSTDPNRWLIGLEDLVIYDNNSCSGCTQSDRDYNDVVVLIQRTNGGSVTSQNVSTEIPAAQKANGTISKIHVSWSASFPPPCDAPPNSRIDLYFSVDDGATWHLVTFPQSSPWDTTIDLLQLGIAGSDLRWKANFVTDVEGCQPLLTSLNLGYEALQHGNYQYTEVIPVANALFRGMFETPSTQWVVTGNDRSPRGHLTMTRLYDPDTGADGRVALWDAGAGLATRDPNGRAVYFNNAGVATAFSTATGAPLYAQVLPAGVRGSKLNGLYVYDLDGNGVVNDSDAAVIVQWTRGWESANVHRAWPLGAIVHSTPAVLGPPGHPWWVDGTATPANEKSAMNSFSTANAARRTTAIVGAADGMLHAFDAGLFQYGDDPSTGVVETRGYFAKNGAGRDYGDGHELWAYVPPSLIANVKNNLPALAAYQPDLNPRATVDGSITAVDIFTNNNIKTVVYAGEGPTFPYITALDVTNPTPAVLWPADWTDVDFNGINTGPPVGPVTTTVGRRWVVATSSGLGDSPGDLYLYLIDAANGTTLRKTRLNVGGGAAGAQTNGVAGSPVMVDSQGDGEVDRVYLADANGRLFKVNTATDQVCLIASLGESVYAPIAVVPTAGPKVRIYLAGANNPNLPDPTLTYHFFAYEDSDAAGACGPAALLLKQAMPAGHKVWAAPVASGDNVFYATATSAGLDVCQNDPGNPGVVAGFSVPLDAQGVALFAPVATGGGDVVGGLRAYDGHLFVNNLNGTTTMFGAPTWKNGTVGLSPSSTLSTTVWYEP